MDLLRRLILLFPDFKYQNSSVLEALSSLCMLLCPKTLLLCFGFYYHLYADDSQMCSCARARPIFPSDISGLMSKEHLKLNMPKLNSLFLSLPKLGSFQLLSVSVTPALSPSQSSNLHCSVTCLSASPDVFLHKSIALLIPSYCLFFH